MPEVELRDGANSVETVLADFDRRKDQLSDLSKETVRLIETILNEEKIAIHSVQARVKSRDKLKSKYCKSDKDYKCLDDISDLVGLRIITYYSDKIDRIAEIIGREFAQCGPLDDKRIAKLGTFGYSALHLDCAFSQGRLLGTEYKRFTSARFEIQVTTVIGHAWAEMHHPWYDAGDSPEEEERRFHRLAAVLELAEQEFLEIRKKKDDRERIASVRVAAKAPAVPISPESLNAFIEQDNISKLDVRIANIFHLGEATPDPPNLSLLANLSSSVGLSTIQQLEDKLNIGSEAIVEFVSRSVPIWDASRQVPSQGYAKGICILHLAYLLASASGEDRFKAVIQNAGLTMMPGFDFGAFVGVAEDVATRSHLL